ncbi:MAG: PAS domain S-box protein, partial [Steroidobacteraceae bacterium]
FATLLGTLASIYYVIEPVDSFSVASAEGVVRIALFVIVATAVSVLCGRFRAANAAMLAAHARLDGALVGGKVGTWTWDLAGGYLMGDRNVARLLEIGEADAAHATLDVLLRRTHEDDIPALREKLRGALTLGTEFDVAEARVYARDGSIRWVSARGRIERDADGRAMGMNGVLLDITDRKRVEEELRASEAEMRLITDAMPALIAYLDADQRYRFNNKAYETWYGVKRESLYGRSLREFLGDEAYAKVAPYVDAVLRGEHVSYETELQLPNGVTRALKIYYVPEIAAAGAVTGFYALVEDLSGQKAAEAAVRASEARFRTMADQAPVLIWIADSAGRCTWFNRPWTEFTGRSMELDLGVGWMDGLHADDRERIAAHDARASDSREAFVWEYRLRRHDGEYRWLLDHGVPLLDDDGRFSGFIGSCIDITERRQMEEALREADRRKDEFLATLAHELRNPLAPIRQAAKVSKSGHATEAQLRWSHDVIDRQVQHMALLLDDLLDVSRITRGTLALRCEYLNVREVIESAVETARPVIDARRHRLHMELPEVTLQLFADPLRLAQVLANILTNAAKYTEPGGEIRIRAQAEGNEASISVRDTGVGIAPEMLPRVFEMFSQVKSSLHQAEGGLGIGLALARGLIDLHGGRMEARSEGLGRGSEFIVRLPLTVAVAARASAQTVTLAAGAVHRRVLIADDNRDAADSLSLLLDLDGHDVRTVHDGAAALEEAERFRPEFVLLDIGMPSFNGYEVAQRLRAQPWAQNVVLVAITGWGQEQDRRRSREAGFNHHLTKPIDPDAVTRLLQTRTLTRSTKN